MGQPEVVIACYRPKPGQEAKVRAWITQHVPLLRRLGLATDRPVVLLRAPQDGTFLEIFEWASAEATEAAHRSEEVMAHWTALGHLADMVAPAAVTGADRPFPHFEAVDGVTR